MKFDRRRKYRLCTSDTFNRVKGKAIKAKPEQANRGQLTPLPRIPGRRESVNRAAPFIFASVFPVETKFWRFSA